MAAKMTDSPVTSKPRCDLPGCGMVAVGSADGVNHCANHADWAQGKDNKDAEVVRARNKAERG